MAGVRVYIAKGHQPPLGSLTGSNPLIVLARLWLIVAFFALLLPLFGPIVDHHFAERRHDHGHIYLAIPAPDHVHSYQTSHAHSHHTGGFGSSDDNLTDEHTFPNDVVFLASNDGMSQGSSLLTSNAMPVDLSFPDLTNRHWLLGLSKPDNRLSGNFVALPKRSPKA